MPPDEVSVDWFTAACKNLALIEEHAADYEDPEVGDKAPSKETFSSVRDFLNLLQVKNNTHLAEPRMFVSSEGHLLLSYDNQNQSLDLRFAPAISYYFEHSADAPLSGCKPRDAVDLICKYFQSDV